MEAMKQHWPSTKSGKNGISRSDGEGIAIVDLRSADDFEACHLPGSLSLPLDSLKSSSPSPYSDARILEQQWTELDGKLREIDTKFHKSTVMGEGIRMLVICYGGDTARIATSVLRARKVPAFSLAGGFLGLR